MTLLAIQFHSWTALKWINDAQQKVYKGCGGLRWLQGVTRVYGKTQEVTRVFERKMKLCLSAQSR